MFQQTPITPRQMHSASTVVSAVEAHLDKEGKQPHGHGR